MAYNSEDEVGSILKALCIYKTIIVYRAALIAVKNRSHNQIFA